MQVDHKIKSKNNKLENLTLVETKANKPRYHRKRKAIPIRKKTDITVYYSTGEQWTVKNVVALNVFGNKIQFATKLIEYDGYHKSDIFSFTTDDVDSILVKSPKGNYTLDHVANGEFVLTEGDMVITLTTIQQTFD